MSDSLIIWLFFAAMVLIGFIPKKNRASVSGFYLAGQTVGLPLFVITNVATWYGGILGVGEFTYRYGLLNWFTQGVPYYLFAFFLAVFFVKKIRKSTLMTIPEVIEQRYGRQLGLLSGLTIFMLSSPAPYLFMTAQILGYVLHLPNIVALLITLLFTTSYVMYGGYTSDLATDVFYFFLMFIGLAAVLYFLHSNYGGISFLDRTLPPAHLSLTGGSTTGFIIVWWIIAVWTFADPGFYQRIQSARSHRIAIYGIIFSILLWFLFDFLTNAIGLYTRAIVPILANPSEAFLELAQGKLPDGLRGFFIVAMLATILSTLNSFLLISGMTFSKEIFVHPALRKMRKPQNEVSQIRLSILITGITAVFICLLIPSVIQMWYTLGSLFIPGIIFLLLSCYYDGFSISSRFARLEWYMSFLTGFTWWVCRDVFHVTNALFSIEPMFAGLIAAGTFHLTGLFLQKKAEG